MDDMVVMPAMWGTVEADSSVRNHAYTDLPMPPEAARVEKLRKAKETLYFNKWTRVSGTADELAAALAADPESGIKKHHTVFSDGEENFTAAVYNAYDLNALGLVVVCSSGDAPERAAYFKFREDGQNSAYPGRLRVEYSGNAAMPVDFDHFHSSCEALRDDGYKVTFHAVVVNKPPQA